MSEKICAVKVHRFSKSLITDAWHKALIVV